MAWKGSEIDDLPEHVQIYISHLDPVKPFGDYSKATVVYMSKGSDNIISGSTLH
jgi:hypothetical protein